MSEIGIVALYQRCVHLGCRVPFCPTSQWFECPCHGSKYNRVGEKKAGPAPRGLDRFYATQSSDTSIVVDTGTIFLGPPIGTNTTGQNAEGPLCV
jgi:cytochrome b6-f complex iron-sulfur subunit